MPATPYPHVTRPLEVGGIVVPNRIVRTAHVTGLPDGGITQRHIDFQAERAKGGYGLIILEYAGVHPSSPTDIHAFEDQIVDGWARMAETVHDHGAKVFQQLWHGGAQGPGGRNPASRRYVNHGPDWSASAVPDIRGKLPVAMTKGMIDEVVEAFGAAARRCYEAGLDGVELHGGHGYLICQFLSPLTNRREDEYGGSLENRVRFPLEVFEAGRAPLFPEQSVTIRGSRPHWGEGGWGI